MVLAQQIAQSCRPVAVVFQNVAAQLNAGKPKFRDFLDRLRVVPIPSDCRVAEANHSRRRRNRVIEIREIDRRIKRWFERAAESLQRDSRCCGDCAEAYDEMTTR